MRAIQSWIPIAVHHLDTNFHTCEPRWPMQSAKNAEIRAGILRDIAIHDEIHRVTAGVGLLVGISR